jgi:hypothetical protein
MLNPVQIDLARLEQDRRLHEAEQDRLVRLARAARRKRGRSSAQALAWLGQRLIAWGRNLQRRGGPEIDARMVERCQPC